MDQSTKGISSWPLGSVDIERKVVEELYCKSDVVNPNGFWYRNRLLHLTRKFPFRTRNSFGHLKLIPKLEMVIGILEEFYKKDGIKVEVKGYGRAVSHHEKFDAITNAIVLIEGKCVLDFIFDEPDWIHYDCYVGEENFRIELLEEYLKSFIDKVQEDEVRWKFVFKSLQGFQTYSRKLECPSLEEVKDNYPNIGRIQELAKLENPYDYGKLIFWYGVAGTGKTYAIRALANAWKEAEFLYITQPESFFKDFGGMYSVLLEQMSNETVSKEEYIQKSHGVEKQQKPKPFRVLVIEDALDLILQETRQKDSSTISRLLNLTEGIIGQGLRLLVLITSNEKVSNIDEAFLRKGRCLQLLKFDSFNKQEAEAWLKNHNMNGRSKVEDSMTLAQLYARMNPAFEQGSIENGKKAGFGR